MSPAAKKSAPARKAPATKPAALKRSAAPKKSAPTKKAVDRRQVVRDERPRQLTDPRVVRALAHPVRLALLEALLREGPLTATEAAELLSDSPGNMSWHLQTLAKYGYVEEAEGGVGRRRPWRRVAIGTTYDETPDDPELSMAAATLSQLGHERSLDRLRLWFGHRTSYPQAWQRAWFSINNLSYLLPEELEKLAEDIDALLTPYRDRTAHPDRRPAGSKPVGIVAYGHPLQPTPSGN